jgi:hypothetical protein
MSLSFSTAWAEAAAFARRRPGPLFGIAFLLLALPGGLLQAIAPGTAPCRLPEPGPWLLFVPAVPVASLIGALAISRLALRPDEGVGAAFGVGLSRLASLLGAALLLALGGAGLLGAALLAARSLGALWPLAAMLVLLALLWARLILLTPIAAVEPGGPVALIRRGWALGAGHFWRLFGALAVVAAVSLAALMAAGALGGVAAGLAAGQPQPGALVLVLVLVVSALLQAVIAGLFTAFVARLYAQLAPDG